MHSEQIHVVSSPNELLVDLEYFLNLTFLRTWNHANDERGNASVQSRQTNRSIEFHTHHLLDAKWLLSFESLCDSKRESSDQKVEYVASEILIVSDKGPQFG